MGMSITDIKQITIDEQSSQSILDAIYHKEGDKIDITLQNHNESKSNISINWGEAEELGKWLLERAEEIKAIVVRDIKVIRGDNPDG